MAKKLEKGTFPAGSKPEDFACFGPAATKDGEFNGVMLVDMGCFNQEGVDSNKSYHAAVCQHKQSGKWYTYFEWGRTGAKNPQFQFVECDSKEEAQSELAKQCHEKNDKRGQWVNVGGLRALQAKPDKDCYLVRPQAKRSTGLPDARTISQNDVVKRRVVATGRKVDEETMLLMRDLNMGTLAYTRSSMSDSAMPTQKAIDEARIILGEAKKRLTHLGDDVEDQVRDTDLKNLTAQLYGRIPKVKPLRATADTWILSKGNVIRWEQDLDAFESAITSDPVEEHDPFAGLEVRMEHLPRDSKTGGFVRECLPRMTSGRNGYGAMRIHNVWKVDHFTTEENFATAVKGAKKGREKPLFQPVERYDVPERSKIYQEANVCCLIHGSRSVNISGILKSRLRMPQTLVGVVLTASMMGDGLYFSDDWQKSAHYTSLTQARYTHGNGSVKGRHAFLFLADVVLGNIHVAPAAHGFTSPPRGYDSVMGKAGFTRGWNSTLVNNEYIVYSVHQQQLRYLIEFSV